MKWIFRLLLAGSVCMLSALSGLAEEVSPKKPTPDDVIAMLKEGNARFVAGKSTFPHTAPDRLALAGKESQAKYAYATVLGCSDSRVPVEMLFDAGVMDIFVIRVAGNVADTDEIGSIEYGLAHVKTPVLVILGHTQCGAVTAVTQAMQGEAEKLEVNIPPLVDNIAPAVQRAIEAHKDAAGSAVIPYAIEENVWQSMTDLFMKSPITREMVKSGAVKVVGALYDVSSGEVRWLDDAKAQAILAEVEASPNKATAAYAEE